MAIRHVFGGGDARSAAGVPARHRARHAGPRRIVRRRQRRAFAQGLKKLKRRVAKGRLKKRDKILEAIGRLKGRYPKAHPFVDIHVSGSPVSLTYTWRVAKFKQALARDGAYLLRSNQAGWSAQEFWETYMQLTVVEKAFRVLKSELLLRPIWHHYSGRTQAHIFVCVLAYTLWKTLDHLAKRAGLLTLIHKPDSQRRNATAKPRPMSPAVILRELASIAIGDIHLPTTSGQTLVLRRVARPEGEAETPRADVRESLRVQALLAEIGAGMGMQIWLPRTDRAAVLSEWRGDHRTVLERLPLNYDDTTLRTIEQIDVLWLRGRAIVRAFEVEHTTSIYSGILRMADLLALQPNMDIRLHIVAPAARREKVFSELRRPVFSLLDRGPLSESCTYLSYDSIRELAGQPLLSHLSDSVLDEYEEEAQD